MKLVGELYRIDWPMRQLDDGERGPSKILPSGCEVHTDIRRWLDRHRLPYEINVRHLERLGWRPPYLDDTRTHAWFDRPAHSLLRPAWSFLDPNHCLDESSRRAHFVGEIIALAQPGPKHLRELSRILKTVGADGMHAAMLGWGWKPPSLARPWSHEEQNKICWAIRDHPGSGKADLIRHLRSQAARPSVFADITRLETREIEHNGWTSVRAVLNAKKFVPKPNYPTSNMDSATRCFHERLGRWDLKIGMKTLEIDALLIA